ncbi:hypothetical protein [Actinoplanes sp. NBRC 101535]|uniref:hypothetical protein n=1 Tax=Actinoplanes sp. NBRC 101535 TaxID=3032196 RepID=UPI0025555151|nr:hypothetical protein [Actinoplanes sp. NBRC 101535]
MTEDHLDAIATAFKDLIKLIQGADPRDRAELYSRIGLRMTYQPDQKTLKAEVVSDDFGRVYNLCPRGDLNPHVR